jgi:hypothetical protein
MATAAKVEGRTGAACRQSGPYRSGRNAKVIVFVRQGATFPPDADGVSTTWVLMSAEAA